MQSGQFSPAFLSQPETIKKVLDFVKSQLKDDSLDLLFNQCNQLEDIHVIFKDGVLLCRFVPDYIPKISTKSLSFLQMQNIQHFIHAIRDFGVSKSEIFELSDLYEGKGLEKVIQSLLALQNKSKEGISLQQKKTAPVQQPPQQTLTPTTFKLADRKISSASSISRISQIIPLEDDVAKTAKAEHSNNSLKEALQFIQQITQHQIPADQFHQKLKDGILLCEMMNQIMPGSIHTIHRSQTAYMQMENIYNFLKAAAHYGVKNSEVFTAADLYEAKNLNQVALCLLVLKRIYKGRQKLSTPQEEVQVKVTAVTELKYSERINESPALSRAASMTKTTFDSSSRESTFKKKHSKLADMDEQLRGKILTMPVEKQGEEPVEYQFGSSIGRGHFGSVYKGLNLSTGEIVAIKRIQLEKGDEDLMKEVLLLKSLSHPNIVRYEGVAEDDGYLNIVLEFVENGSLYHSLKQFGCFPEKLTLYYTLGIIEGLLYLHERNVIHCDLKAANILTTKGGIVKLSDFGVSKEFSFDEKDTSVAGTPNWMAPEIIELKGAQTASDIWSLGCTIIELMTGKPPYSEHNSMTVLFKIVEDDCPPVSEKFSNELRDFLIKCCFPKAPEQRWTCKQLKSHAWFMKAKKQQVADSTLLKEATKEIVTQEFQIKNEPEPNTRQERSEEKEKSAEIAVSTPKPGLKFPAPPEQPPTITQSLYDMSVAGPPKTKIDLNTLGNLKPQQISMSEGNLADKKNAKRKPRKSGDEQCSLQ